MYVSLNCEAVVAICSLVKCSEMNEQRLNSREMASEKEAVVAKGQV